MILLYSDSIHPLSHCIRIIMEEKDACSEIEFIDTKEPTEELMELNPYHIVLTLVDRELILYDDQVIIEYLNERFPHPPLLPIDPAKKAINRQLRQRIIEDLYSLVDDLTGDKPAMAKKARRVMIDHLTAISPYFEYQPYFMSDCYTLLDCYMSALLWRLPDYDIDLPDSAVEPLEKYKQRIFSRKSFKDSLMRTSGKKRIALRNRE